MLIIRLAIFLCFLPLVAEAKIDYFVGIGGGVLQIDTERMSTHIKSLNRSALDTTPSPQQMNISTSAINMQFGLIWGKMHKVLLQISKAEGINYADKSKPNNRLMSVQILDIAYQHSFNNFGIRRGLYLGGGITHTTIDMQKTSEEYGSKNKSLHFSINFGYEHQFNKHFTMHAGWHAPITAATKMPSQRQKEMQYEKFYKNDPAWWAGKTDSYKAKNKHKYFVTDYYQNKRLFSLSQFLIGLNYIF